MIKKEERLKDLNNEKFYFILFDGTMMPNAPRYTKITMFDDIFYIEDETTSKQYIDVYFIVQIQQFLTRNLTKLNKITTTNNSIKNSFQHRFSIKINGETYSIDRNSCDEEGKKIYDYFKQEIFKILGMNNSK